jgi:hypothetical protein
MYSGHSKATLNETFKVAKAVFGPVCDLKLEVIDRVLQWRNSGCRVHPEFASEVGKFGTKMTSKESTVQNSAYEMRGRVIGELSRLGLGAMEGLVR